MKGFVYIVTHNSLKWRTAHPVVKIGCAIDIKKRVLELNTASPIDLILVSSIQSDDARALEHYLHVAFGRNRLNGEWFSLDSQMVKVLRNQYLIEDRFDELFELGVATKTSHDLEIAALREEIRVLRQEIKEKNEQLFFLLNQEQNDAKVRRGWGKFARGCKCTANRVK